MRTDKEIMHFKKNKCIMDLCETNMKEMPNKGTLSNMKEMPNKGTLKLYN
jgi:hypothetical protein